jgi:hypothetical protein
MWGEGRLPGAHFCGESGVFSAAKTTNKCSEKRDGHHDRTECEKSSGDTCADTSRLDQRCHEMRSLARPAITIATPLQSTLTNGADDGIRTRDLRFTKPLLYQPELRRRAERGKITSRRYGSKRQSLSLASVQAGRSSALAPNNRFNAPPNVRPRLAFPARATNTGQTARLTMLRVRSPMM